MPARDLASLRQAAAAYARREALNTRIAALQAELARVETFIANLGADLDAVAALVHQMDQQSGVQA